MKNSLILISYIIVSLCTVIHGHASDEVKLLPGFSPTDHRYHHPYLILRKALEATIDSDGPFEISYFANPMVRDRALIETIKGSAINVHIAATRDEWEKKTIPIRIPILKGLLGYRLFLVHKKNLEKFKNLYDVEIIKRLKVGSGSQWTTTKILKKTGFNVVTGINYEGLFSMLNAHRFDYFPRGVNEIFHEFDSKKEKYPNITIEPTKILYFPTPNYFFVSPKYPILADRIRRGLETIIRNGLFDKLFQEQYRDIILRAKFNDREILKIENPFLSPDTPLDRSELWFSP
jgi:hypothetical protein